MLSLSAIIPSPSTVCDICTISLPSAVIPSHVPLALQNFSSLCYYSFSFYVAPALLLFHLLLFLLPCDNCTISLPSAIISSPSMWHLHYSISLPSAIIPSPDMWHLHYFSSLCYYSFSFYVTTALFLFLLLLFLLLICGTTISLPCAIIPSPSMWQLHYFSSFCYYSFSFYLALALIIFLLLLFIQSSISLYIFPSIFSSPKSQSTSSNFTLTFFFRLFRWTVIQIHIILLCSVSFPLPFTQCFFYNFSSF